MGKSLGNYIGVAESAENQFGKIMSIPDEPMRQYFTLLTELPLAEVDRPSGHWSQPARMPGKALAKAIVAQYHGADSRRTWPPASSDAAAGGEDPDDVPVVVLAAAKLDADGRITRLRLAQRSSASNPAARMPAGSSSRGDSTSGPSREVISNPKALVPVYDGLIVRVGKRKILVQVKVA